MKEIVSSILGFIFWTTLVICSFLYCTRAKAAEPCGIPKPCVVAKKVVHKPVTKTVVVAAPPKTETASNTEESNDSKSVSTNQNANKAITGNQSVIINLPPQATSHHRHKKTVFVYRNPNRLLFLLGQSRTKINLYEDCCHLRAKNEYRQDFGLEYLRDFGQFTGAVVFTNEGSRYIGLGINF